MPYCFQCGSVLNQQTIDQVSRLVCGKCDYIHWQNPVPVVAVIVELDGQVVLARNKQWPPGVMSVIAGYLEKNEMPEQAVKREVLEELNLQVNDIQFIGHYIFQEKNQLLLAFAVQAGGQIQLGEELVEYKLIPKEKLQPWDFGTGPAVKDWLLNAWHKSKTIDE